MKLNEQACVQVQIIAKERAFLCLQRLKTIKNENRLIMGPTNSQLHFLHIWHAFFFSFFFKFMTTPYALCLVPCALMIIIMICCNHNNWIPNFICVSHHLFCHLWNVTVGCKLQCCGSPESEFQNWTKLHAWISNRFWIICTTFRTHTNLSFINSKNSNSIRNM